MIQPSYVSSCSAGIARSRPGATNTDCETARNSAPDGDLTIPLEQTIEQMIQPSYVPNVKRQETALQTGI